MIENLVVLTMSVLGQMPVAANPQVAASSVDTPSVWDFMLKGGPMMIPIGLFSLIALAVVVERAISLRRGRVIPRGFFDGLGKIFKDGNSDKEPALAYCQQNASPIANIVSVGIRRLGEPVELLEKHIQEAGEREVLGLRRYVRVLAVTASIAPLMGLLGTIFGMISAFQMVAASGEALGKTELLAEGIYEAMVTTAAGLLLAIPVLIAYHWITAKIERLVCDMDQLAIEFVEQYAGTPTVSDVVEASPKLHAAIENGDHESEAAESSVSMTAASA